MLSASRVLRQAAAAERDVAGGIPELIVLPEADRDVPVQKRPPVKGLPFVFSNVVVPIVPD